MNDSVAIGAFQAYEIQQHECYHQLLGHIYEEADE